MNLRALGLMGLLLLAPSAWADLPPFDIHARYEEDLVAQTLHEQGLVLDPHPLGKRIERIVVAPHDVFLPKLDPVPQFVNWFHVTTKPYIVSQELLFKVGDRIGPDTLEESARNLRSFFTLAIARIVAAKGTEPDSAVVVVVAKDLWTLRPNTNIEIQNGKLDLLSFTLAEHNLAGRNKFLGISLRWDPGTFLVGERYTDPRLAGSRIQLDELAQLVFNRERGHLEGVNQSLSVSRPLYSLSTKWAWSVSTSFQDTVGRLYRNGEILPVQLPSGAITRYEYRRRLADLGGNVTRSFGLRWKQTVSLGYFMSTQKYTATDPLNAAEIGTVFLPFSEDATQISARYNFYEARFVKLRNVATYDVTEDYRMGPDMTAGVDWASSYFGLPNDYVRLSGSAGSSWLLRGENILGASVSGAARYWPASNNPFPTPWVNRTFTVAASNISPRFGGLRLHTRGFVQLRDYDISKSTQLLGATSGLRGFPAGQFEGRNSLVVNAELRTGAIAIFTVYVGAVFFYDGGAVFPAPVGQTGGFHQNVGGGLRFFLPQFNHQSFRIDLAFPIFERTPGLPSVVPTAAFGQVF